MRRALGTVDTSPPMPKPTHLVTGGTVDCTSWQYWLAPECWYSQSAKSEMAQFTIPPEPPHTPAVPLATSGQAGYSGDYGQQIAQYWKEIQGVDAQQHAAENAQTQAWAQTQPEVQASTVSTVGDSTLTWIVVGVAAAVLLLIGASK